MKNNKTLIGVFILWLLAESASWALGQWLTASVSVSEGEVTTFKSALHLVLFYLAGQFGFGMVVGVALVCLTNGSAIPNIIRKIRSVFIGSNNEVSAAPSSSTTIYNLGGSGASAPGGGGGAGGALGDNSVGGNGGNGGSQLTAVITPEALAAIRSEGIEMEVVVGAGGRAGKFPGEHGEAGGETGIRFKSPDGTTSKFFGAPGGLGGRAGYIRPPNAQELTAVDLECGFKSTSLMMAEVVQNKFGLLYILGGAISSYGVSSFPCDMSFVLVNVFSSGALIDKSPRILFYAVNDPDGVEIAWGTFVIDGFNNSELVSASDYRIVEFVAKVAGVWVIRIFSGEYELARLPFEIHCPRA